MFSQKRFCHALLAAAVQKLMQGKLPVTAPQELIGVSLDGMSQSAGDDYTRRFQVSEQGEFLKTAGNKKSSMQIADIPQRTTEARGQYRN